MPHDLAIRGGTLIDGTGAAAVMADLGISQGVIQEIGPAVLGRREIDARGQVVAPGFIDIHTHYDPQVLWDPQLSASSRHGVTSVVAGNCGFSIAPAKARDRHVLVGTLDKVEDMNPATLNAGITWDFETYPEYLAAVARRGLSINFGGYVGHTAVRLYVMGEAGYERAANDGEIAAMRDVVAQSIRGGAIGFSSDRAGFHLGYQGRPVPSMLATQEETESLMRVTADIRQGIVHVAPGENYRWVFDFQRSLGRTLNWSAILTYPPNSTRIGSREKMEALAAARRGGGDIWAQVTCRPITQAISLLEPYSFAYIPAFAEVIGAPREQRGRLYADTGWRERVKEQFAQGNLLVPRWHLISVAASSRYPEHVGKTIDQLAAQRGTTPFDTLCDVALADECTTRFDVTFANDDAEEVAELLRADGCIMGLSDAGAHVAQICDSVLPTDFLANWVRDRGVTSLESGIRKLTGELGSVLGIERGCLKVGAPADVVVFDLAKLTVGPIRRVNDMPAGGERLLADAPGGIAHVIVNGVPVCEDNAVIDRARPGQIIVSPPQH